MCVLVYGPAEEEEGEAQLSDSNSFLYNRMQKTLFTNKESTPPYELLIDPTNTHGHLDHDTIYYLCPEMTYMCSM